MDWWLDGGGVCWGEGVCVPVAGTDVGGVQAVCWCNAAASATAFSQAYKYVPFGAVDEVIPYLVRRAQENSDMLGGVGQETAMMRTELRRRLLGGGK